MNAVNKNIFQLEQNLFAKFRYLPQKLGFKIANVQGVTIINCSLQTSMFNIVCDAELQEHGLTDSIQKIIEDFKGQPFAWWLGPSHTPKTLGHFLQQIGFIQETTEYAMLCDLKQISLDSKKSDLTIKEVTNADELLAFAEVLKPYDAQAPLFYQKVSALLTIDEPFKLFVGYVKDLPVCTGSLFFINGLAGIYDLITDEKYQGRGFGTTMMQCLMNYAKQKDFDYVSLSASSDSGFRIYERLGFKSLGIFECFEWLGSN